MRRPSGSTALPPSDADCARRDRCVRRQSIYPAGRRIGRNHRQHHRPSAAPPPAIAPPLAIRRPRSSPASADGGTRNGRHRHNPHSRACHPAASLNPASMRSPSRLRPTPVPRDLTEASRFPSQLKCDSLPRVQDVGGGDGVAARAELFGGPAGAGFGGGRRRHGGAVGGRGVPGQRVVHLQGVDPAAAHRGGQRQLASRSPAAQADAGAGSRLGGAYYGPSGPHPGKLASVVAGCARGSVEQRGDVDGSRPPWAVV
jgi:hypothetical protein